MLTSLFTSQKTETTLCLSIFNSELISPKQQPCTFCIDNNKKNGFTFKEIISINLYYVSVDQKKKKNTKTDV